MLVEHKVVNPLRLRVPDVKIKANGEIRYDEDRITVARTIRDDPLGRLHHRGQINEASYEAGRVVQGYFEQAEVGRIHSPGDIQEPVDGGNRIPEVLTEAQRRAIQQLNRLAPVLGQEGYAIISLLLMERKFAHQIAAIMGHKGTQRDIDYIGRRIRECLMAAARSLGFA